MIRLALLLICIALPIAGFASNMSMEAIEVTTNAKGVQSYSLNLQVLGLMTFLTLLPALVLMMTSFTRIVIILSILRQALGMPTTPSNQIIIGLSLFLSFFIMAPVFEESYTQGFKPYSENKISLEEAIEKGTFPLKEFMYAQTREEDLILFSDLAGIPDPATPNEASLTVLIPSFITSELKTAFQIGFVIFVPFLVIDLVVASVLMAMGMMMLSPLIISLPFKIMLFVLVDGWALLMGTIAASFGVI